MTMRVLENDLGIGLLALARSRTSILTAGREQRNWKALNLRRLGMIGYAQEEYRIPHMQILMDAVKARVAHDSVQKNKVPDSPAQIVRIGSYRSSSLHSPIHNMSPTGHHRSQ